MKAYFTLPTPLVQAVGTVCVPTCDKATNTIEQKPVAAAVVTMSQRDDGLVTIFAETLSAIDEMQFPLAWLVEQELLGTAPTLVSPEDRLVLAADAAAQRFFVEPKLARLLAGGEGVIDGAALGGNEPVDEAALCRRLQVPTMSLSADTAMRIWTWFPREDRVGLLGEHATAAAISRLMVWANLMATRHAEPGWFYEPLLGLRSFIDECEHRMPTIYKWGTCKPVMRAVSFESAYREDLALRQAGEPGNWPAFASGTFFF